MRGVLDMRAAQVNNDDIVVNIVEVSELGDLPGLYDFVGPNGQRAKVGYQRDDATGNYAPVELSFAEAKASALETVTDYYEFYIRGVTIGGVTVRESPETTIAMNEADMIIAAGAPEYVVKHRNGFKLISAANMTAYKTFLYDAMVRAKALFVAVSGTTTKGEIAAALADINSGWPGQEL